jgi:magnesium-transporting ATPase (P-type)
MLPIINTLIGIGGNWLDNKQKIAQAKTEAEIATINARAARQSKSEDQNYDLDRLAMENMEKSWKDEVILLVFLAPMIMSFIPSLSDYALAGFGVIAQMPEWYRYIIIGMVVVIYGLRGLLEKVVSSKLGGGK